MPPSDDPFPDDLFLVEPAGGVRPDSYLDPPSAGLLGAEPSPMSGPARPAASRRGPGSRLDPGRDPDLDSELDSELPAPLRARERVAGRRGAPLPVAAAVAALWAGLTTYGVLLALTLVATAGTRFGASARFAGIGWLLSYGVPVRTAADQFTLVPLALTALAAWRLVRAGIHTSRATGAHRAPALAPAFAAGAAVGVAFAGLGAAVALVVGTADLTLSPVRAGLTLGLFAFVAATAGALGHGRPGRALRRRLVATATAARVSAVLRTGAGAACLILAAGAGIAGVALAVHGGDAAAMLAAYRTGGLGQAGITLLCLAFAPNVAVWGSAYLLGPGFSVGVDTVVSPGSVIIGPLPGVPVLAGLPSVPLTGLGPALLGVPVLAGICAGILLARRRVPGSGRSPWGELIATAALSGVPAGLLVQAAAYAAGGALGSGRLGEFGTIGWSAGAVAAGVVAVGAMIGAAATRVLAQND